MLETLSKVTIHDTRPTDSACLKCLKKGVDNGDVEVVVWMCKALRELFLGGSLEWD
jgi:hypothetical protein